MASSTSNLKSMHKDTSEKKRIRDWERKNEIHPLAYYELFDFNETFYDENDYLNDSDSDGSFSSSSEPISHTMLVSEAEIGGLIAELNNLENDSQRTQVTTITRDCTCNINSNDSRNTRKPSLVASRQRNKVSSPAA